MATVTVPSIKSLHILVVEDDEDTRENLADILRMDGHEVQLAGSVADARDYVDWSRVDVMIIDRNLPDGRAEQWLPRLKQLSPTMDTVVITAYADLDGTIHALRERVADYLIKPINPDGLLASLHGIARRRQAEQELTAEREFADRVFDTAEAVILVLDREGRIVRFNRFLEELSGYELSEVRGAVWFDKFIPEGEREWVQNVFRRTVQNFEMRGVLNPIRTRFGRLRQIRWSNALLRDRQGEVQLVLSVGLDVTDLVEAQQRALQHERLATIGQTMTALAHESRNALQRIQAGVELLEMDLDKDSDGFKDLQRIERAAHDLRSLLEEVRSYAAPIQLDRTDCSLAAVWRRAWQSLEPLWKDRDVRLEEDDEPKMAALVAQVDAPRLQQVFRNLFENALAMTPDPACVRVTGRQVGSQVVVQVSDNGPGIKPDQIDHLFEPFYTTRASGTGLGLAIAQRIIDAHGGTIVAHIRHVPGAEFEIVLPRQYSVADRSSRSQAN